MALFEFTLTPVDAITPWGHPGQEHLHWYALSDGRFWIEAGPARPLGEGVDFYIAQIWESLVDIRRGDAEVLDLRCIEAAPEIRIFQTADAVRLAWPDGHFDLSPAEFAAELASFHERFFAAMAQRPLSDDFAAQQALRERW